MMIPIALSSIVVIALGVSRFITLRKERKMMSKFVMEWDVAPTTTEKSRFISACETGPAVAAAMADIFEDSNLGTRAASERLESIGRQSLLKLETGIGTIATLAAITPLMGFLGTVTGMIRAFMQIQNLGGNVNANVLAGGIWEALVTTATGLAVGILALIIHNYLTGLVRSVSRMIEQCGEITLRLLGKSDED